MLPRPKKRLGQNFLVDKNMQRKIVCALEPGPRDIVLEIGSGRGELTRLICPLVKKVIALELDKELLPLLCSGLKDYPNCQVIHKDILDFDLRKLKGRFKVFGNIPYYISTPIIERLLQYRNKFDAAYLTVQKEFAERITAPAGTKAYGSLSCFVQYYFAPKIMLQIKKTCFYPAPKVDSCLIRLETRRQPCVRVRDEALFFKLIRSAFNQRRKTLRNSLRELASARALREFYNRYNIDVNIRPERLGLGDFANLADILAEKRQKKS